jgi:hypothetical protein
MGEAQAVLTWLLTPDAPDVDAVLAQIVNRPSWQSVGPDKFFQRGGPTGRRWRCATAVLSAPSASAPHWLPEIGPVCGAGCPIEAGGCCVEGAA